YDKRAWSSNLLKPASVAYNGAFYVLASVVPASQGKQTLVFSSTAVNAGIPCGDALVKTINSAPAKTKDGMPEFKNTDISVVQKDLVNNLKDQAQKAIDQINQASKDSEVYLEAGRLTEKEVPQTAKDAIVSAAGQVNMKENLFWMDLAMVLQIPEQDTIKLGSNLAGTKVTVKIPDFAAAEKGYSRSYKVFAWNPDGEADNKAEVITPEFDAENQTLSFILKKSSVYAIGYHDEKDPEPSPDPKPEPDPAPTPSNNSDPAAPSNPAVPASSSASTAANTHMLFWGCLTGVLGAAMIAIVFVLNRKS
ncbi:MAG: hypothetical protein HUJ54_14405, partial [Erysipelotrichaceae bacterium]|nr:hypothetical protein [Erysipelotrichaceae bacterium]